MSSPAIHTGEPPIKPQTTGRCLLPWSPFSRALVEMYMEYLSVPVQIINAGFILMAVIKATLVAMYYMHLKFDSYVYTILFVTPVLFAVFLIGMLGAGLFVVSRVFTKARR